MIRPLALALCLAGCGTVAPAMLPLDGDTPTDATAPDAATADTTPAPPDPCDAPITAPSPPGEYPSFYSKMLVAEGVPVLSSARTSDVALRAACRILRRMVGPRDDVREAMLARGARVAVMARDERTLDIPEHADLQRLYPDTDWNTRARGLGGTVARPVTSCAEENLRCDPDDRYRGENILVHELAHGMFNLGVSFAVPDFPARLRAAFDAARAAGRWANTYAGSNLDEYFAEGVQCFFDTNLRADPPNGIHNHIHTRAALRDYDPALYALVAEVFPGDPWTPTCP